MSGVYYNEIEPYAAEWLRQLISAGELPAGDVDERSIVDVQPDDVRGYVACHFFAGIGGWPFALRLAGWPDDASVWTGSCPCQPFSTAGKRAGTADKRHLWPEFHRLIAECCPPVVLGEQVASKDGRVWLAGVRADLEALGYAVGAADLCAAGIGAPHIRQRLYWVADADSRRWRQCDAGQRAIPEPGAGCKVGSGGVDGGLAHAASGGFRTDGRTPRNGGHADLSGEISWLADAKCNDWWADQSQRESEGRVADGRIGTQYVVCGDGKERRIEPGIQPVAYGVPVRVGQLRAYGNAIVPPLAAEFIQAYQESRN